MKNLTYLKVAFEVDKSGMLFSEENRKSYNLSNSIDYPVTHGIVDEYKKVLSKDTLAMLKKGNSRSSITMYGYEPYTFKAVNICRFTFNFFNGKIEVEYRPFVEGDGFPVQLVKEFDTPAKARKYVVNMLESHLHENIDIKENFANYFTRDM